MDPQAVSPKPSYRWMYWTLALLFAGVLLYFSLRGIQWRDVWRILTHAKLTYVSLSLVVSTFALFLRALRWRVLLSAGAPVSVPTAFWATAAGYFGNNFLPARAGEVIRSLMVSSASGLSKTFVLTTALAERLCDAISLVLISSVVLLTLPFKPGWFSHAATPFAIIGLVGASGIALLPRLERQWGKLLEILPFRNGLKQRLRGILEQIMVGMRSFHDGRRLSTFAAYSAVIWFSDAIGTLLGMQALGLHGNLAIAFLLVTGLGLGSALPSTPGYVGIYQFVAVSVLTPFGFSKTDAIAYILLSQAAQYALITFWGAIGIARARAARSKISGPPLVARTLPREI